MYIYIYIYIYSLRTNTVKPGNQKRFHEHLQNEHNRICDWEITIIDHAETVKSLRQKELYWYHKSKTYAPFGLNERDVYAAY